jgi:hypothetical protein
MGFPLNVLSDKSTVHELWLAAQYFEASRCRHEIAGKCWEHILGERSTNPSEHTQRLDMTDSEIQWQIDIHAEHAEADEQQKAKIFRMIEVKRASGGGSS